MTKRDFFRLMIKLFGLYQFLIVVFTVLPSQFNVMFSDFFSKWITVSSFALLSILTLGIFYFLIKFPDKIIDFFKLDKGFDSEKITINNLSSSAILQIGLILIAGFLIVDNFASFFSKLIYYFKMNFLPEDLRGFQNSEDLIFSGINLILGFILIIFRKQIAEKFSS